MTAITSRRCSSSLAVGGGNHRRPQARLRCPAWPAPCEPGGSAQAPTDRLRAAPLCVLLRGPAERETGLEPATNSLEGCDSSQLSYSRGATGSKSCERSPPADETSGKGTLQIPASVGRGGFEPPKAEPTDLQSVPFDRSGTSPRTSTLLLFWGKRKRRAYVCLSHQQESNPRRPHYK